MHNNCRLLQLEVSLLNSGVTLICLKLLRLDCFSHVKVCDCWFVDKILLAPKLAIFSQFKYITSFVYAIQVAMVEIQIGEDVPESLLIFFGACTTLLVAVHLVALMISTCILPNVESVCHSNNPCSVNESPHDTMRHCVEIAWICSTGLGILLFLVEIALLCWVKFYGRSHSAAIASTIIVIPTAVLFIFFSLAFYRKLLAHKNERHEEDLRELEQMTVALNDNHVSMQCLDV